MRLFFPVSPRVSVAEDDVAKLTSLYEEGQYFQAHQHAATLPPVAQWLGAGAQLIAGRLAMNLGAPRLSEALFARVWREHPTHPGACYYRTSSLLHSGKVLRAQRFIERWPAFPSANADERALMLSLR